MCGIFIYTTKESRDERTKGLQHHLRILKINGSERGNDTKTSSMLNLNRDEIQIPNPYRNEIEVKINIFPVTECYVIIFVFPT